MMRSAFMTTMSLLATAAGYSQTPSLTTPAVQRDIPYVLHDNLPQTLDIYTPANHAASDKTPAVLVIHGGGWCGGSKSDLVSAARALANAGLVAVCIDYRLASANGNHFPAQLDDVQTAVRWVRANAGKLGIDPDKIGAFGHSAGGHLAALLATSDTRDNTDPTLAPFSSRVQAVVDASGPSLFVGPSQSDLSMQAVLLLTNLFGKPMDQVMDLRELASPALHIDANTPPILLIHGTADTLVPASQSEAFYKLLQAHGRDATLLELPHEGHNFSPAALANWTPKMVAFFKQHL